MTTSLSNLPSNRPTEPGRTMLTIANSGRMSRFWLAGMGKGAMSLGIRHAFLEVDVIRKMIAADINSAVDQFNQMIIGSKIGLVVSYALNAAADLPVDGEWPGAYRNFFEVRGIPQFFLWADHPQWVGDKQALEPKLQPVFRSGNQYHFLKSQAHAYELNRILGWPNCYGVGCGADPNLLKPQPDVEPDYDLVAIYGNDQKLADWLLPFLDQDDPQPAEINRVIAEQVRAKLAALWEKEAPSAMRAGLGEFTERIITLKLDCPEQAFSRHINRLTEEFPRIMWWLTAMFPTYFRVGEILYAFRSWQRHFYLAWLSKSFRVGLFGGKWSHVGPESDREANGNWVDFAKIPSVAARGKVALDIVAGWDEEGLTAKTFELASCGVAMIHNECVGLDEAFKLGQEMEVFTTPKVAAQKLRKLLDDADYRRQMGRAARDRVLREHTWAHRVERIFQLAQIPIDCFKNES